MGTEGLHAKIDRHKLLRQCELGVSLLLSALVVAIHVVFWRHAGGLWRDEVQMVNLATMPTLTQLWGMNEHDTYPLVWQLIIRCWTVLEFGQNDLGLRLLGLMVGLGIVGMLWFATWQVCRGVPLLSLVLVALSPPVIMYGDSLRGYGMGALTMIPMIAAFWLLVEKPTRRRILWSAVIAILAVQASFFNAVILFAVGIGGVAVNLYRRCWHAAGLILGIGLLAAVSLLPYLDPISRQHRWNSIVRYPLRRWQYLEKFTEAVNQSGGFMIWVWLLVTAIAIAGCVHFLVKSAVDNQAPEKREQAIFLGVSMVVGLAAYGVFLFVAKVPTQVWYYIAIMGLLAVLIDATFSQLFGNRGAVRILRIGAVIVIAALIFTPAWQTAHTRMTSVDSVARKLEQLVAKDDLILVNPWHPAITFNRYYHGAAPWLTLPDLSEYRVQRFDLLRDRMSQPDPIRPVLDRVAATLGAGNRLWVVGNLELMQPGELPGNLLPYPNGPANESPYVANWSRQAGYLLQRHADRFFPVALETNTQVHKFENLELALVEGWH